MKFKFKHTDKIVGIFFFVAILVLLISFFVIAISQKLFIKKYVFNTKFIDAVGISESTSLNFKGFEIGRIKTFTLNKDNYIDVEIIVFEDFRNKIVSNSAINKTSNPITGKSNLEFLQGPDLSDILPEGSYIPSLNMPEGQRLLIEKKIIKSGDVLSSVLQNIDDILYNLNQDNNQDEGALFRMLYNLANSSENLNKDLIELKDLIIVLKNQIQTTTDQLNNTLAATEQMVNNYKNPDGIVVKMIDPTEKNLIQPLNQSIQKVNESLTEINKLLIFLNTESTEISDILYESKNSLKTVQKTLQGINNNPLIRGGIQKETVSTNKDTKIRLKDFDK